MPRAIPILVIVGLAIYSFFDVLHNRPEDIRRFSRTTWLVLVLIPIVGAALWFIMGRPRYGRGQHGPPRIISLRSPKRPQSPDDDPQFLRKLEEEAWRRKREERRKRSDKSGQTGPASQTGDDTPDTLPPESPGSAP